MEVESIEETGQIAEEEIIKTKHWELPASSLEGWRPYTAYIDYRLLLGPSMSSRSKGLSLHKDLMGGQHGARGSGKSLLMTYLLMKKMRSGKTAWTNYPISFYVIEENGDLTYYESMPIDMGKFYSQSREIRNGAVGIDELQYYAEARTSGREQNRLGTYKIMQIRKSAMSFLYCAQDRRWVDKRFGWSNDFDIECVDVAKLNYDEGSVAYMPKGAFDEYGDLREGAISLLTLQDTSGVLTGTPYNKSHIEYGDIQFDGYWFWNAYPTNFEVNIYEAMYSYKKKSEKAGEMDDIAKALELAINEFVNNGQVEIVSKDLWRRASELGGIPISPVKAGQVLGSYNVPKRQKYGGAYAYDFSTLVEPLAEGEN